MKVSCIVLCTLNDLFVRERLLPSLRAHGDASDSEIIVVDNGPAQDLQLDGARVIRSEPYHVARGYNAGVAAARGRYVALFHDDCLLQDPHWLEKATRVLSDEVEAVGPDLRRKPSYAYLKEVPLVLEKKRFQALGGYDESHYLGYQSDLLCIAIEKRGRRIEQVDIDCTHFCIPGKAVGMSTLLLLSSPREREALRQAFASPSFSLADMEKLVDEPRNAMRARYFFHFLIVGPIELYVQEKYGNLPRERWPTTDQLVRDGSLVQLMPRTREEMERLVSVLGYHNELVDRVGRIARS